MDAGCFARCLAAWTSRQGPCESDDQVLADRRDRVDDVSFGTDGRRFGVDDVGKCQTSRIDWPRRRLRGEAWPARRSGRHRRQCTMWRDVEAAPAASLVVSKAEFLFQLLVI